MESKTKTLVPVLCGVIAATVVLVGASVGQKLRAVNHAKDLVRQIVVGDEAEPGAVQVQPAAMVLHPGHPDIREAKVVHEGPDYLTGCHVNCPTATEGCSGCWERRPFVRHQPIRNVLRWIFRWRRCR